MKMLYLVETDSIVFHSDRRIDALYKHIEYRRGQARYKAVRPDRYTYPKGKQKISLRDGTVEEAV